MQNLKNLYRSSLVGTLAVDGWAVTFGTARRGPGGTRGVFCDDALYKLTFTLHYIALLYNGP